jgi:hypothetical protein
MLDYEVFCSLKMLFPGDHFILMADSEITNTTNIQTNNGFNTPLNFLENA